MTYGSTAVCLACTKLYKGQSKLHRRHLPTANRQHAHCLPITLTSRIVKLPASLLTNAVSNGDPLIAFVISAPTQTSKQVGLRFILYLCHMTCCLRLSCARVHNVQHPRFIQEPPSHQSVSPPSTHAPRHHGRRQASLEAVPRPPQVSTAVWPRCCLPALRFHRYVTTSRIRALVVLPSQHTLSRTHFGPCRTAAVPLALSPVTESASMSAG
jgi:hypothetical protein